MPALIDGPDLKLGKDEREKLGADFVTWFDSVTDARRERMNEVWVKALDNYEGIAPKKSFPWPLASNAFLPVTGTHVDALASRFYNAATGQDPAFLILPNMADIVAPDPAIPDQPIIIEEVARWFQSISEWAEKETEYRNYAEELIWVMCIFGDAFLYIPWEKQEVMDIRRVNGKIEKKPRSLWDQPRPRVLLPQDVYINSWEHGTQPVQTAKTVGIAFTLDAEDIELRRRSKMYDDEISDRLLEKLDVQKKEGTGRAMLRQMGGKGYFKEHEGSIYTPSELEKKLRKKAGIAEDDNPNTLQMVRLWTRHDLDEDGTPEEIIFDAYRWGPEVPMARHATEEHRRRPLVQFGYSKRPGSVWSRGVPELLFNIQKVLNQTIRDILDNNKVQNTKMFVARRGSGIERKMKVWPGRIVFATSPRDDFIPVDLGSGRTSTSLQDIVLFERWAQFITGITDFNLGQERRGRTAATTTLALIEEGAKRNDRIIAKMRGGLFEVQWQVMQLYFEKGDVKKLAKIAVNQRGELTDQESERRRFELAWAALKQEPELLRDRLLLEPQVSSNSLNRGVLKQEKMALMAQADQFYQRVIQLANAIGGAQADPTMRQLFIEMYRAGRRLFGQVLDTFEQKDQKEINPDLEDLIQGVTSVELPIPGGGVPAGPGSSPAEAAQGLVGAEGAGAGPVAPVGRPPAGGQRPPGPDLGS